MLETQFPIQFDLIEKAAQTEQGVLITGENGTGKENIARIIHNRSSRAGGSFVVMNCSLSGEILETEFQAKMEAATGGTIYFEEINELPLHLQAKLVQNQGATRIIASTSQNIQESVSEKLFRSDLFSKLSYVSFSMPALRDRVEQIPTLVSAYIEKFNRLTGSNVVSTPSPEAIDALLPHTLESPRVLAVAHLPLLDRLLYALTNEMPGFSPGTFVELELDEPRRGRIVRRIVARELAE